LLAGMVADGIVREERGGNKSGPAALIYTLRETK
jgi:hypothetical protein